MFEQAGAEQCQAQAQLCGVSIKRFILICSTFFTVIFHTLSSSSMEVIFQILKIDLGFANLVHLSVRSSSRLEFFWYCFELCRCRPKFYKACFAVRLSSMEVVFQILNIVFVPTLVDLKMLQRMFCWFPAIYSIFQWGCIPWRSSSRYSKIWNLFLFIIE